ncbi:MAG TPA: hypothetical protein VKC56_10155 [Gallionellaceae bacterium]|nr:hypothetical protein [Gallionellaceae bacterium]
MDAKRKDEFVQSWMAIQTSLPGTEPYESNFWAHEELADLCEFSPDDAWEVILALVHATRADTLLQAIGAGPLADLMTLHGEQYIALVEGAAEADGRFRMAMTGAWLDGEDTPVWKKYYEIAGIEPPFPNEGS